SVPGSPNTGPLLRNGRKAGAIFATEAFSVGTGPQASAAIAREETLVCATGASEPGASWASVGDTATSIDARKNATTVLVPTGAESVSTVTASARATPQTRVETGIPHPLLFQQLA